MNIWKRISSIIIPTTYEDALSYSEMVRKIGGKLNEVVEWINNTKFVNTLNGKSGNITLGKLKFTGYSQEEYNGDENVTVRIPTGVGPNELGTLRVQYSDGTRQEYDGSESITIPGGGVEKVNGKTGNVTLTAADVNALPTSKENTGIKNPMALRLVKGNTYYDYDGSTNVTVTIPDGGGGEGGVTSVNGQTGAVVITPINIGAQPIGSPSVNPFPVNFYDSSVNPPSLIDSYDGSTTKNIFINQSSGGGGITPVVTSVNGQTGAVQLNADSVGAIPSGYLQTGIKNPNSLTITIDGTTSQQYDGSSPVSINLTSGGEVSGVTSVNGKTGVVVLNASDVGAIATGGKAVNPNVINFTGYYTGQYDGSQQANVSIPNKLVTGQATQQAISVGSSSASVYLAAGLYIVDMSLVGGDSLPPIQVTSISNADVLLASPVLDVPWGISALFNHFFAIIRVYSSGTVTVTLNKGVVSSPDLTSSIKFTPLALGV